MAGWGFWGLIFVKKVSGFLCGPHLFFRFGFIIWGYSYGLLQALNGFVISSVLGEGCAERIDIHVLFPICKLAGLFCVADGLFAVSQLWIGRCGPEPGE